MWVKGATRRFYATKQKREKSLTARKGCCPGQGGRGGN